MRIAKIKYINKLFEPFNADCFVVHLYTLIGNSIHTHAHTLKRNGKVKSHLTFNT